MARRILLADDSVTAQNMGRRILTDAGYEVITVNNGSAALKKIAEQKPDLIVLDVYMPGYGGLEVCSRVKENKETARIPVLLTVGKLEPFKAEEARRVHADAYVVKPFEASELLTALSKLEDKIVPQPEPYKPGRFAKAIAAAEETNPETGERFGDRETGWKERLIIPGPGAKPQESEHEVPQVGSATFRDGARSADFKPAEPKVEFERPIPAGLPADITPEEIAAITAAAASFGGKVEAPAAPAEPEARPEPATKKEPAQPAVSEMTAAEAPAATFASTPEAQAEAAPETKPAAAEVQPPPQPAAASEAAMAKESPAAADASAATAGADAEIRVTPVIDPLEIEKKRAVTDPEVIAALASLGIPANGDGMAPVASSVSEGVPFTAAAAMARAELAAVGAGFSGPRWIAEAVPVPEDESAFMLEREMEKAYAAFAAADAGRASLTAAPVIVPSAMEESSSAASVGSALPVETSSASVAEFKPEEPAPAPEIAAVAESIASTEPEPAAAVAVNAAASTSEPASAGEMAAPAVAAATGDSTVAVAKEEAAYAAAAAAGSSVAESMPTADPAAQPVTSSVSSESASAPQGTGRHREAELAAAWASWKHVRETIVDSQLTSQIADAAAAELKDVQKEEAATAQSEPQPEHETHSSAAESTAIANIVDSVLAELKPKLVEEIAKKMGNDKKKEKEKKSRK